MKRILLMILVTGILLLGACNGPSGNGITHYFNEALGYSVDYPEDWFMEELSETKIGIMPADIAYNQIQIDAYVGEPTMAGTPDEFIASAQEATLQQFAQEIGGLDLVIPRNERTEGQWEWVVEFTMTYEDTPLQGGVFITESETAIFTIFFIQAADWPQGQEVINSFSFTE